jgi:HAD superfamily hydrolase (TIGR01490 family)
MSLAIFDLDNTLLNGDSDYLWGEYLVEQGVVNKTDYAAQNAQFFADYKAGTLDILAFQHFSMQPLANNTKADLTRWRDDFITEKIQPLIGQAALDLVEHHRQAGDTLLIITATNSFVTRPIADCFGIPHLIGTIPEQIDGQFTGQIDGIPSFHAGKVKRLHEWLQTQHISLTGAYFYSDSHNDLPLLQIVDHPVAVNPDDTLRAHAIAQSWPILDLQG